MTKKNILLVAVLLALIAVYAVFFTDWFKTKTIKVFYTYREVEHVRTRKDLPYILFLTAGRYRLTEVKVVSLADFQKNPTAPSLWHLVSDSNSIPVKEFVYGQHIHGMRAPIGGEYPSGLETNVVYRLLLSAGGVKGHVDFSIK